MKSMVLIENPIQGIQKIEIFEPSRGEGGTLAFPVKINAKRATFEMNDDCNWKPVGQADPFDGAIAEYIHDLIETSVYGQWLRKKDT